MERWQFYRHMPVYGQNGRLIGRAEEIGHAMDVIHIQRGHVLIQDWFVPVDAIDDVTEWGVVLNVNLADLRRNKWNVPPQNLLALQGATPGYEYASPADTETYRGGADRDPQP